MVGSPPDIDGFSLDDLKELVFQLLEENATLRQDNAALREEIARLKGLKGRPEIKPSGMDKKAKARSKAKAGRKQARRGKKKPRLPIDKKRIVAAAPEGARFKGYEDYLVQDLVCRPQTVLYRRERWLTPDGRAVVAKLPAGISGHFGPALHRFVLAQYHQGQTTVGRMVALLRDLGVDISKRQVQRLLTQRRDSFVEEARDVLRSGLEAADWVSVDDTGARHGARNGVCTQIGNDRFSWFGTTFSKSRLNFLELLRAGHGDYVVNGSALAYMRRRKLSSPLVALLEGSASSRFANESAWMAHLESLGITKVRVHPDPVRVATEGALWGSVVEHKLLGDTVILSDDAGQFNVARHALCWVHAERLIHKLDAFSESQRRAKERMRSRIWWFYADLKSYRENPEPRRRREMRRRFDKIFTTRTGFATLDRLLSRLHANKEELLVVLDRPEVPLNTNGSENDIRCQVMRRKISGGTRSDQGRECRDAFLGLMKTCNKLGVRFWDYLGCRLSVPDAPHIPPLQNLIRQNSPA